ncbi:hypothetical protein GW937_00755 [Candidatus Kaiserbacteria bacterium]|nr:hypothetical protein [Candidatus Kaiserbacteria bacterium]
MLRAIVEHFFLSLFIVSTFWLSFPVLAFAQQVGVSIKPAMLEETLDPGVTKQYSLSIENLNAAEQTYYLFTRNISGVKEGGVPIFASDNFEQTGYELADWIVLPYSEITIPAKGQSSVDMTLTVPMNASPGSHFGGVFISVDPPKIENSGAAVGYQVASVLSIRVNGDIVEEASIRQFSTSKFLHGSQNVEFDVRIENNGNVLVRPMGPLEIYNMLGNKVGDLMFNEERFSVFPNDTREFKNIVWTGDSIGFGRYEAILSPVYGESGAKKTMSSSVTFWILPMNIIGPALVALGVLLLVIFIFVRLYIRRSLAHLNQGRRIVHRRSRSNSSAVLLVLVVTLTVIALSLIVLLALFA